MKDKRICNTCLFSPTEGNLVDEAPCMCATCMNSNKYQEHVRIPLYEDCLTCVSQPVKTNSLWTNTSRLACNLCFDGLQHDPPMIMEPEMDQPHLCACLTCEWDTMGLCELGPGVCKEGDKWALEFMSSFTYIIKD